jgi:transketolase
LNELLIGEYLSNPPFFYRKSKEMTVAALQHKSIEYRRDILNAIWKAKAGHTGGSLSCVDILNVLYNHVMDIRPDNFERVDRDHYIHSKGHSVEALYVVLADKGFFSKEVLGTMEKFGSDLIGHPTRAVPGIEQNTGALGHGLAIAAGVALAGKKDKKTYRVFTILGDGELTEGSIWEAGIIAAHYRLDNLVMIVDRNTLQITGRTESVMATEPLEDKFRSFGFAVRHVDGNDIQSLIMVFDQLPFEQDKPNLVIAHTIKGKGVSFMEDNVAWHHHVPTEAELAMAMSELQQAEELLQRKHGSLEIR